MIICPYGIPTLGLVLGIYCKGPYLSRTFRVATNFPFSKLFCPLRAATTKPDHQIGQKSLTRRTECICPKRKGAIKKNVVLGGEKPSSSRNGTRDLGGGFNNDLDADHRSATIALANNLWWGSRVVQILVVWKWTPGSRGLP